MSKFRDSTGREWSIAPTILDFKRVRAEVNVDILNITDGQPPLSLRIATDDILLVEILWALLEPTCQERGVTPEDFGQIFDGATLAAASEAFWSAMTDFFLKQGRDDRVKAMAAHRRMMSRAIERSVERIESLDINSTVDQVLDEASAKLRETIAAVNQQEEQQTEQDQAEPEQLEIPQARATLATSGS